MHRRTRTHRRTRRRKRTSDGSDGSITRPLRCQRAGYEAQVIDAIVERGALALARAHRAYVGACN